MARRDNKRHTESDAGPSSKSKKAKTQPSSGAPTSQPESGTSLTARYSFHLYFVFYTDFYHKNSKKVFPQTFYAFFYILSVRSCWFQFICIIKIYSVTQIKRECTTISSTRGDE